MDLDGRWFLVHPDAGVLEVRSGETNHGMPVFATVTVPHRWFLMFRGFESTEGLYAEVLWEVDPGVGQRALDRRSRGDAEAADVIAGHLDVRILREAPSG
ncbi:hypothetical protein [Isoptericola sp. BMS4]|uniref:hypothetical protein n=1 Tax=Isoptericola sp. BMS4 TaxID=2527875 RepID=UPI0014210B70|nr:hypothetical protein [Isoptericola sp. BMS4]